MKGTRSSSKATGGIG